jgi:hypothetical protein
MNYWKRIGRSGQWVLIQNGREMASVPPMKQTQLRRRFYNLSVFGRTDRMTGSFGTTNNPTPTHSPGQCHKH